MDKALVAHLRSLTSLQPLFDGRFFLAEIPEKEALPALSYIRLSQQRPLSIANNAGFTEGYYQLRVAANSVDELLTTSDALEDALHGGDNHVLGIHDLLVDNRYPDISTHPSFFAEIFTLSVLFKQTT